MDQKLVASLGVSYTPKQLNYHKVSSVVFEKLVLTNENGTRFDFVSGGEGRLFELDKWRGPSSRMDLGTVTGKRLRIEVSGYGILRDGGGRSYFSTDEVWFEDRSTRFGPAICFIP